MSPIYTKTAFMKNKKEATQKQTLLLSCISIKPILSELSQAN
ncbi:hypothetical protein bpmyx0001_8860 [Bacillus pseudomycoides DSM 12442]|nr:hypothetical protein bpmyx0001_8860 [Bacillus pseudomycoides DSM 12442]